MPPLEVILQQAFNGLMLGVMYALIAVGFTLFFGGLDVIHFSHGDICTLGAFAGLSLTFLWAAVGIGNPAVALLLTFLGALVLTALIGAPPDGAWVEPPGKVPPLMAHLC